MAPESVTQDRIYNAVKSDYMSGLFRPGVRIELQPIADRHRASTTPVREAIHRLMGERLLQPYPDGGFMLAVPGSVELAHLYIWYCQQLLGALHLLRNAALARALDSVRRADLPSEPQRQIEHVDQIFHALASATGNGEIINQIEAANERLRYPRFAETYLFSNVAREIGTLTRNGNFSGMANVRRRIIAYHDRRILHATEIASAIWSTESNKDGFDFPA